MKQNNQPAKITQLPLTLLFSLGLLSFIFTLYTRTLTDTYAAMSPLWLSTALIMAAFYRNPVKLWPLIALVCGSGSLIASSLWHDTSLISLAFTSFNIIEALVGALLLRRVLPRDNPLASLNDWAKMLLCGTLIPSLVGAVLTSPLAATVGLPVVKLFSVWVSAEAVGTLAFLPIGLLFKPSALPKSYHLQWITETILTLAVTLVLGYLALSYLPWPLTFIIVVLMWSAIRLPRLHAFLLFFAAVIILSSVITTGYFSLDTIKHSAGSTLLAYTPWLPFLMLLLPANTMTMVMYAFKEERKLIAASETRFRNAMEYSAIGMALVSPEGKWMQVNQSLCRFLGYSPHELLALTFQQITWPGDLKSDLEKLEKLTAGEINSYSMEKRYYTREGNVVWALLTVSVVRDPDNNALYYIAQIEDINELKHSEQVNRQLMERITLANEAGGVGIWEWDLIDDSLNWDKRMYELYDVPPQTPLNYNVWLQCVVEEERAALDLYSRRIAKSNEHFKQEFRINTSTGIRHIRSFANRVLARNGETERFLGINMDMTEVKELNEALYQEKERLHITLDSIGEAVICTDVEMKITFMNPIAERLSGCSHKEALGLPVQSVLHITLGDNGPILTDIYNGIFSHPLIEQDMVLHSRQGAHYDIHYSLTPLTTLDGHNIGSVMVIQDVTESKNMLKQLSYSASHDSLTQLANRFSFENHLRQLLQDAIEHRQQHALVFIDLDRFKAVNDSAGHAAGDALLREISAMVLSMLRTGDLLARLGGDEFALILPNCSIDNAFHIAEAIIRNINHYDFIWEGVQYRIGASAGLTRIHSGNAVAEEVLSQADIACYASKNGGRGRVTVYDPHQLEASVGHSSLQAKEIREMIHQNQIMIVAQSIAPVRVSATTSFYFLSLRFWRNNAEVINEETLRPQLQDPGLQYDLDLRVIKEFFNRFAATLTRKGFGVTLPVSAVGLSSKSLVNELLNALAKHKMPARLLHLSISSEVLSHASAQLNDNLQKLKQAGCKLLISHVNRAPEMLNTVNRQLFDYVMIDSELMVNIHENVMNEMMVSIIHGHAHRLSLRSIAGPAETQEQFDTLSSLGIDLIFGESVSSSLPLDSLLSHSYFAIN
ncbi:diguanylate cyclase [uncultured Cedecea sp.]|uniref:diguanylate cyclase n=1 Tax=uncultured Cedecea sp. TaxID=988762 RepID=UPI002615ED93|nr:diguanylate cyclase [uncultured Cedecea sp.]